MQRISGFGKASGLIVFAANRHVGRYGVSAAATAVTRSLSKQRALHTVSKGVLHIGKRCFSASSLISQSSNNNNNSNSVSERTCWRCQRKTSPSKLFCDNEKCAVIQPVGKNVNYFDVLMPGLPPTFAINVVDLRLNFLKLQQAVHPDSYSQREQIEHKLAETQSSWINHAYSTLKDPLSRAQYLLKLSGNEIAEEDQITDPDLLMEIMETREEIEMAKTEQEMAAIKQRNDEKIADVMYDLKVAFAVRHIDRAKLLTNKLQYLRRVAQAIHAWEPGKRVVISH
ncbi:molecular chaperone [Coemansia sp. RSA 1722]|nr:molecular chaperone [Coemansia sp. RSA 485]KAJ2594912.1 molecular chaperone [Coemansia sp. RSA 1722]